MNNCSQEALTKAILAAADETNGKTRLPCAQAFKLAAEFGVTPAEIGRVCNEQGIRISGCQLGCF